MDDGFPKINVNKRIDSPAPSSAKLREFFLQTLRGDSRHFGKFHWRRVSPRLDKIPRGAGNLIIDLQATAYGSRPALQ
jgi:hypothetical protein